ncbi:uncharacterized protein LOC131146043 [Malania oleifera]|uniref:uncharacterized protein LOC131146043 n=1 Tax=Malania oleifera TaxID=397392 RepID=UPI0025ADCBAA|nr:uncharacterized protein LOC131146043 [Malania oleifera]
MASIEALFEIWRRASIGRVLTDMVVLLGPVGIAFLVGVVIGWKWKPKWASVGRDKLGCVLVSKTPYSPSSLIASPSKKGFGSMFRLNSLKMQPASCGSWVLDNEVPLSLPPPENANCSMSKLEESFVVPQTDFEHLYHLVELKDGGPTWIQMMDRSTPNMSYQAWRRDPENGPPQYRSRTVFEHATPELVRDFFWDDEFRSRWDDMLIYSETIEECPTTGSMVVHWIRKFPFFCSDREYIIGRRIWELGNSYYCVTKGVPSLSVPRRKNPRRVDLYYSSWCIRAVESKRGNGQWTACEVLLFHHEEMGIPREIAKLGVRQGMWGAVKKIEPGLRAYQNARASGATLSQSASLAQINTKVNPECLVSLGSANDFRATEIVTQPENPLGSNIPKFIVVGGAVLLACSLDHGLLTKAVIFGVARRFAKIGRRL